jgi:predicted PurR-regulated permease PerM
VNHTSGTPEPDSSFQDPPGLVAHWPDTGQLRLFAVLAAAGFGLYLSYLLTVPFLPALTWALVLSVVFAPAHGRIEARIRHRNAAALISVAAVAVLVVVPLVFVAQQLVRETANGAVYLESALRAGVWRETISSYPNIARAAAWLEQQLDPAGTVAGIAAWLAPHSTSLLRSSVGQLVNAVLIFYLLFFFLRDRQAALRALQSLSSLSLAETSYVIGRFADTIHATVFGTLVMAVVQGALSGLMFWWLDLPLPLLWGTVMGILAIVPVLGAFVVWVPAAIFLALAGEWGKALILTVWGGGVVASIDNILYPMLVGNRLKLHTVPALIGAFGGIIVFGASGLVLGPATIAVTLALLEILKKRFSERA